MNSDSLALQLSPEEIRKETERIEIGRYLGYEKLIHRYLTLPFDATIGNNQLGRFMDIGFIFLAILPIIFLIGFNEKNKLRQLARLIGLWVFFSICMNNTEIVDFTNKTIIKSEQIQYQIPAFFDDPSACTLLFLKKITYPTYVMIDYVIAPISNDKDYISYPILLLIVVLLVLKLKDSFSSRTALVVSIAFITYGFFWLTLASGIIWYGYFGLVLGLFLIGATLVKHRNFTFLILPIIILSVVVQFVSRISNIPSMMTGKEISKKMLVTEMAEYAIGRTVNQNDLLNKMSPNLSTSLEIINQDLESKVIRVGTSLSLFIKQNRSRVQSDNQFKLLGQLIENHGKTEVLEILKASDIRFMILDLNLMTVDSSPEKSLTKRYTQFLDFLYQNENLSLLSTDRITSDPDDPSKLKYSVFGPIQRGGSYAIYEIL